MTNYFTFTKRVAASGSGYLVWIPKNVVDFLSIDENTFLEAKVCRLNKDSKESRSEEIIFTKKTALSGRGYLLWIPKDVSDYLCINPGSFCEFKIRVLGGIK